MAKEITFKNNNNNANNEIQLINPANVGSKNKIELEPQIVGMGRDDEDVSYNNNYNNILGNHFIYLIFNI